MERERPSSAASLALGRAPPMSCGRFSRHSASSRSIDAPKREPGVCFGRAFAAGGVTARETSVVTRLPSTPRCHACAGLDVPMRFGDLGHRADVVYHQAEGASCALTPGQLQALARVRADAVDEPLLLAADRAEGLEHFAQAPLERQVFAFLGESGFARCVVGDASPRAAQAGTGGFARAPLRGSPIRRVVTRTSF